MPLYYRKNPDIIFSDSFELVDNWNGTYNIESAVSGSSNFTTPLLDDSFEISDNW